MSKSGIGGCSDDVTNIKAKACTYSPLSVKNIELRRIKSGQVQVRLNGKGKWINAELDGNTLRFYA